MGEDADLAALLALRRSRLRRRRAPRRRGLRVAVVVVLGLTVAALVGAAVTGGALLTSCNLNALRPIPLGESSFLYARDGSLLGVVPSQTNRQPLELSAMSPWLPKATVAIEDRRFWQHGALDYQGIMRALYRDLSAGKIVQGGSTITQELVRNLYIGNARRTLSRKLKEACLARKLAHRWSKKQILAAYLNEVFYGRHAYGAQAGAETLFSTGARALTLPQAALLAGLPQAPSVYDPFAHPGVALRRRNDVLQAMFANRDITAGQYAQAAATPLGLHPGRLYTSFRHPNFFGWAEDQLIQRFGVKQVEAGGLQVQTTLDPRMQAAARDAITGVLQHRDDPAAALVAIDPRNGAVRAMLPYVPDGRTLQFNLATQSGRTAGSAFKPFTLATAVDQGISLYSGFSGPPQITIPDRMCLGKDGPWNPHNYGDESAGYMNLLDATAHSVNTIFAQLVVKVGPANVVREARKMGITTPLLPVCSITLGTQPVNPLEMTDGYATLAARGIHHDPQAFELVRGPDGRTLGTLDSRGTQAIPQRTADQVTAALQRVVQYGTGTAAALSDRPTAGKTGTAENYIDAWFCGFVPQLAACVWIGYPKAEISLYNVEGYGAVFGGSLPAEIWHRFMSTVTANMPVQSFVTPTQFPGRYVGGSYYSNYTTTQETNPLMPAPRTPPPAGGGQ